MEYTEPETARMLVRNGTQIVVIEANNGGRGFRRNVEKHVRQLGNWKMTFEDFTQTENKLVRIFSHSAEVMNMVAFPDGWETMYPQYYAAMSSYRKEGRNEHDDAPDATTRSWRDSEATSPKSRKKRSKRQKTQFIKHPK